VELKARDYGIDWLKAFAIVLVVSGHAIQYSLGRDFDSNILFRLIYSFHMPLFIFISGYLISPGKRLVFLWKQFKLLMIPFLIWMVLYSFYYRRFDLQIGHWYILPGYYLEIFKSPGRGGLWFLWALYMIDVIYFFLRQSRYFYVLSVVLVVLLYVGSSFYPELNSYGLRFVMFFYPYFLLGCFIRQYQFGCGIKSWCVAALIGLSVLLEMAWTRVGTVNAFGMPISHEADSLYAIAIRILTPVPLLLLLFLLSRRFKQSNAVVQWLSVNTLSVYASHFAWIYLLTDSLAATSLARSNVEIVLVFVIASLATWGTIAGINQASVVRKLLFGR
jgi:fucose 4-O-acetylase-like acetyltransferase